MSEKELRKTVMNLRRKAKKILVSAFGPQVAEQLLRKKRVIIALPPGVGGESIESVNNKLKRETIFAGLRWSFRGKNKKGMMEFELQFYQLV